MSASKPPPEADEQNTRLTPWSQLVEEDGVVGVVLDPEEEAELVRREAEIPELDRQGLLRPIEEFLAELRGGVPRKQQAG